MRVLHASPPEQPFELWPVEIRPLRAEDPGERDALLALYRNAIPAAERKSDDRVLAEIESGALTAEVCVGQGKLLGFLLLFQGVLINALEYLATSPEVRGQGLGARLYARARHLARPMPLIVEVESGDESGPDQELRQRRIGFYRRLGCRTLEGLKPFLPLPDADPAPTLSLLVDHPSARDVERAELRTWLTELYVGVYGTRPDDPRLKALIASLPSRVRLI